MCTKLVVPLAAPLAEYKKTHDEVVSSISDVPPKVRHSSISYRTDRGIPLARLSKWGKSFISSVEVKIGVAQDQLADDLEEELGNAATTFETCGNTSTDIIKFQIQLDYGWGGSSSLAVALVSVKNNGDGKCDVSMAFFGEKWVEEDHIALIEGSLPDWKLQRFLIYRLLKMLPDQVRAVTSG